MAKDTVLQKDPEYLIALSGMIPKVLETLYSIVILRSSSTSSSVQTNESALLLPLDLPHFFLTAASLNYFLANFQAPTKKTDARNEENGAMRMLCQAVGRRGREERTHVERVAARIGGEKRGNMATDEQAARGGVHSPVFVGFGVQRKCLSLPWRGERGGQGTE